LIWPVGTGPTRLKDAHSLPDGFSWQFIAKQFTKKVDEITFDKPDEAKPKQERLAKAIENSKSIAQLAGNPLLLTMMAILNRNQKLPDGRVDLYAQCS